jgi:hypothetical protein
MHGAAKRESAGPVGNDLGKPRVALRLAILDARADAATADPRPMHKSHGWTFPAPIFLALLEPCGVRVSTHGGCSKDLWFVARSTVLVREL